MVQLYQSTVQQEARQRDAVMPAGVVLHSRTLQVHFGLRQQDSGQYGREGVAGFQLLMQLSGKKLMAPCDCHLSLLHAQVDQQQTYPSAKS